MGYVRSATVADAVSIAPHLREADRQEVQAFLGVSPEVALPMSVGKNQGDAWAMIGDAGELVGLFGVDPVALYPDFGLVWLVATDDLKKYQRQFLREGHEWLDHLHALYPLLGNYSDSRNKLHHRWLKWMGFSFLHEEKQFGPERRPFIQFARLQN